MNNQKYKDTAIPHHQDESNIDSLTNNENTSSRRQLLLNGIVKGSAVAASVIPIKSLATQNYVTSNGKICTVSGTQSAAHSQASAAPECSGWHPSYYCDLKNWPGYSNGNTSCRVGTTDFNHNSTCKSLFRGSSTTSLYNCLKASSTSDYSIMITALLNAIKSKTSTNKYPYSPEEILNLCNTNRTAAITFCRDYMQTKWS